MYSSNATTTICALMLRVPRKVAVGKNHSLALTRTGELYSWGHGDRGRLGFGISQRSGVTDSERFFFPSPMLLHTLSKDSVRQVRRRFLFIFLFTS